MGLFTQVRVIIKTCFHGSISSASVSVRLSTLSSCCDITDLTLCAGCSAAAQLLQPLSEQLHLSLHFLVCVAVAVYRYGRALALSLYSCDPTWAQSGLGRLFLPASGLLAWLCCATSCWDRLQRPRVVQQQLWQLVLMGLVCLLDLSPVLQRLASCSWTSSAAPTLLFLQVPDLSL